MRRLGRCARPWRTVSSRPSARRRARLQVGAFRQRAAPIFTSAWSAIAWEEHDVMRRWIVGLALPLAAVLVLAYPGVWSRALALAQGTPQNSVYFGYLQGTPRIGGVAIDLTAPDANGARILRAYVCDGMGPPEGMAVWFRGDLGAETFPGGEDLVFSSAGGQEKLRVTMMNGTGIYGAYTEANGATS